MYRAPPLPPHFFFPLVPTSHPFVNPPPHRTAASQRTPRYLQVDLYEGQWNGSDTLALFTTGHGSSNEVLLKCRCSTHHPFPLMVSLSSPSPLASINVAIVNVSESSKAWWETGPSSNADAAPPGALRGPHTRLLKEEVERYDGYTISYDYETRTTLFVASTYDIPEGQERVVTVYVPIFSHSADLSFYTSDIVGTHFKSSMGYSNECPEQYYTPHHTNAPPPQTLLQAP